MPSRRSGPIVTSATSPTRTGVPSRPTPTATAAVVAEAADRVVRPCDFDRARAHVLIGPTHRVDHLRRGHAVREEFRGVEQDLILLHEPAEARDLGDAGHRLERVADLEVS